MGRYVNPGNQAFRRIAGADYVDKTGLISLVNDRVGGDDCLICVSRPRRFGKSYAAKMLTAYYDCSCDSHSLFDDKVIAGRNEAVAEAMNEIRQEQYAPQFYNNEQSLRAIIKYAYIVAASQYVKIEEMPIVFIPTPLSRLPAMVIELKWNRSSHEAISQIKDKRYDAILKQYTGNLILVGINYDEKTGEHTCLIERV